METPPDPDPTRSPAAPPRHATLREVFRAVAWSFLGVRKRQDMHEDAGTIRPHQVVIVGLTMAAVFVLTLVLIVRIVLGLALP